MPTLKIIATQVCDALDRPFDGMFLARVKDLIMQEASMFIRRSIEKDGIDTETVMYFDIPLTKIDKYENTSFTSGEFILRSVSKIPKPIRYKSDVPFVFVGTLDKKISFTYCNGANVEYDKLLPLVGTRITYDYTNEYIRIYNNTKLELIRIGYPVANMRDAIMILNNVSQEDADNLYELPIPYDIINQIKTSIIKNELSVTDDKDKLQPKHLDNI